jgi:hypothetical protein
MSTLKKAHQIIFLLLVGIYFTYAGKVLIHATGLCFASYKQMRSFSPDQKRRALLGEIVEFAAICNKIIPENSRALLLANLPSCTNNADLLLNYYVYPRKLYWINVKNSYPDDIPVFNQKDYCALQAQGINWIIYMYSAPFTVCKIVQLETCGIAASYIIDREHGQYVRDR